MIEAEPIEIFLGNFTRIDLEKVQSSWEMRKDMWQVESARILTNLQRFLTEYYP
jgi:hypothetical protein